MLQMLNPSKRAKVKTKVAKARAKWNWKLGKAKARRNWLQLGMKKKQGNSNLGLISSVVGGAAGLVAIFAVTNAIRRRANGAQKGQAPKRSQVQLSSAQASRPLKKMFARA